jgi:SAM-dependent methyltransferase
MSDYAEIPYESLPIPDSHPERLDALGQLFGLSPADPGKCRILELGCASGGNLIPLGFYFPGSRCVGIDLYANQIAEGQALVDAARLANVELRQGDILDLRAEDLGTFDYVVVHGVYSWVPEAVRQRILALCAEVLAPHGIAYVSYNTLPGWRMRGILRDILGYATRRAMSAREQVAALAGCLQRMQRAVAGLDTASARYLAAELGRLKERPASYVVHEFLESENRPLLLTEFVASAEAAGLRYVCDTDLQTRYPEVVGSAVADALADLHDTVEREQYLDFVVNRNFRRSLLCRGQARPTLEPMVGRLEDMHVAATLVPPRKLDLRRPRAAPFTRSDGTTVEVHHPLTKAALLHLGRHYPDSVPVGQLVGIAKREAVAAGGGSLVGEAGDLVSELYSLVVLGAVELLGRARVTGRASAGPLAPTVLARAQLASGGRRLATRLHTVLALDNFAIRLLEHMDGTRSADELACLLLPDVAGGRLVLDGVGGTDGNDQRTRDLVRRNVERLLGAFVRAGVVVRGDYDSGSGRLPAIT